MQRVGDIVALDFAGTDPLSDALINFYLSESMFRMFFAIYMIKVFDPQVMFDDGFYGLIDGKIARSPLLRSDHPAALSDRNHALVYFFDSLGGLLGQRTPEPLCAAGLPSSPHSIY